MDAGGLVLYNYDDENQLILDQYVSADWSNGWRNEYTYDGKLRLRKSIQYYWTLIGGTKGVWTQIDEKRYLYDGMLAMQERNSANPPTATYTRGTDLSGSLQGGGGIGGMLARSHGYNTGTGAWSTHNFYHADGNGNVTYMVSSSQTLAASYRYNPFGQTITSSGGLSGANTYRFSSKEFRSNSGMYYYGYRWYNPYVQRWVSRDPLNDRTFKKRIGAPVSRKRFEENLYSYVWNNSLGNFQGLGLDRTPWPFNGSVCNCLDSGQIACVLIDGDYYSLPPGECTASSDSNHGGYDDVDGVWIGGEFYKVGVGGIDVCNPPKTSCEGRHSFQSGKWNEDPNDPNSPSGRGSRRGNDYPEECGPMYQKIDPTPPTLVY
jgi:RHS repeat-associated protein